MISHINEKLPYSQILLVFPFYIPEFRIFDKFVLNQKNYLNEKADYRDTRPFGDRVFTIMRQCEKYCNY